MGETDPSNLFISSDMDIKRVFLEKIINSPYCHGNNISIKKSKSDKRLNASANINEHKQKIVPITNIKSHCAPMNFYNPRKCHGAVIPSAHAKIYRNNSFIDPNQIHCNLEKFDKYDLKQHAKFEVFVNYKDDNNNPFIGFLD
jgi:hypothetical protein